MALPDYIRSNIESEITFKSSGGTALLTPTSLANGSYRQSDKADLGANHAPMFYVVMEVEMAATPTAGNSIDVWFNTSSSATAGTDNQGGVGGTDSAYTGYSSNADASILQLIYCGALTLTAQATATVQKGFVGIASLPQRYASAVIKNGGGSAFHSSSTNFSLRLIPISDAIIE